MTVKIKKTRKSEVSREIQKKTVIKSVRKTKANHPFLNQSDDITFLFNSIQDCLIITDPKGFILEINKKALTRLAYKKNELDHQPLLKIYPEEFHNDIKKIIKSKKSKSFRIPFITKTGRLMDMETYLTLGQWYGESVYFFLSQEVHESTDSEQKLRLLIEHTDQNVSMVDRRLNILEFNGNFEKAFKDNYGIRIERGSNLYNELKLKLPEMAEILRKRCIRALSGESFSETDKFIIKDKEVYVESRLFPIFANNMITGVIIFANNITQSKIAEQALRASEEKYKMAFNYAAFGMVINSADAGFIDVNPYFCDMVGYARDELLKMKIKDIVYKEDYVILRKRVFDLFSSKIPFLWLEARFVHKKGYVSWGLISSTVLKDKEGKPLLSISHIQDITEKKKAENELRKKSQQQENILETARHLTKTLDLEDVLNRIAVGAQSILESSSVAIYFLSDDGKTLKPVIAIDPDYRQEILSTSLYIEKTYTGQAIIKKQGIIINEMDENVYGQNIPGKPIQTNDRNIITPFIIDDEILGALVISRNGKLFTLNDLALAETYAAYAGAAIKSARMYEALEKEVEERKLIERGLSELNLEYENFIQNNLVGIWKIKLSPPVSVNLPSQVIAKKIYQNAVVTECNDVAAKMHRFKSREEILKTPLKKLKKVSRTWMNVLNQFIYNGFEMKLADIEEYIDNDHYHHRYSFFGNVNNNLLTWIWGIQLDITDQKHLEEQLLQSQKIESIGTLAGGIAHDFNNLLTVINGHAELALMKTDPETPIFKDLNMILEGGIRAENLTRQLLAFSRKQFIQPKVLDLNQLIINMDKMLRRLMTEDIIIETDFDPNIAQIKADPGQIEQILMNLVINARDALNEIQPPPSEKHIQITTKQIYMTDSNIRPNLETGNYVAIIVTDNGVGIDASIIEKIFDPFFTTKAVGKGTGLGLATTYGIIRQNKGSIEVESQPGKGAKFTIYWPAYAEKIISDQTKLPPDHFPAGAEQIIIVEDDEPVRRFAASALKELGYQVISFADARSALLYFKKHDLNYIALLITDIVMPVMNGKDLANKLNESNPHLKTLFTSGYVDTDVVSEDFFKDKINFLQKPYSMHSLATRVREIIDQN